MSTLTQPASAAGWARILPVYPRAWRDERRPMALIFVGVFFLYAFTAARYVVLEDDALFIGNLHFWGVGHPPGYPAHALLGGIFYRLVPFGSPAFKAHLFSGFAAALACAALYAVARLTLATRAAAALAALAYAASKTFWSQAVVAEAYALNAFLFFAVLALCIVCAGQSAPRRRLTAGIAVLAGLGLANHYPLFCLAAFGLPIILAAPIARRPARWLIAGAVAVAAPFYAWMVWRSRANPVYNFYGPIENADAFAFYFLRRGYADIDRQSGVGWDDKLAFVEFFGAEMAAQFTLFGLPFVAVGCWALARRSGALGAALTLSFLASGAALIWLLDFRADFIKFAVFRVYPLIAYGIMALWLAAGVEFVASRFAARRFLLPPVLTGALAAMIVGASLTTHWGANNRRDDRRAHDLAMAKLSGIERGGILFTHGDLDFPLGYLHYVEGVRPDLLIYNSQGLIYNNRLYGPLLAETPPPDAPEEPSKIDVLRDFVRLRYRPVYYNPAGREFFEDVAPDFDVVDFFYRAADSPAEAGRVMLSAYARRWLAGNLADDDDDDDADADAWTRYQMRAAAARLVVDIVNAETGGAAPPDEWKRLAALARDKYPLIRVLVDWHLARRGSLSEADKRAALDWTERFDAERAELFDAETRANFYSLRAVLIADLEGEDSPDYGEAVRRALAHADSPDHPAVTTALRHFAATGDRCAHAAVTAAKSRAEMAGAGDAVDCAAGARQ